MRPPRSAAENTIDGVSNVDVLTASMRPPRSAAENHTGDGANLDAAASFNEAAAFCGGK